VRSVRDAVHYLVRHAVGFPLGGVVRRSHLQRALDPDRLSRSGLPGFDRVLPSLTLGDVAPGPVWFHHASDRYAIL
jgi:hypothetical protein